MSSGTRIRPSWWHQAVRGARQWLTANLPRPDHIRRRGRDLGAELARPESRVRTAAVQIGKSTLAAVAAWYIAARMLGSEAAWLAPGTAVLMVHATVYRSIAEGVKRVVAVAAGVAIAAMIGNLIGLSAVGLLLTVPLALLGARLPWIHAQGEYIAITAVLLLTFGASTDLHFLVAYLVATAVGCVVGALTNLLLFPPAYLRSARGAISELATGISGLLADIGHESRQSWSADTADEWHRRAVLLDDEVRAAESALSWSQEGMRWNPWPRRQRGMPAQRYWPALELLRHVAIETQVLTRGISDAMPDRQQLAQREDGEPEMAADELLAAAPALAEDFPPLIAAVAEVVDTFGDDPEIRGGRLAAPVADALSRAEWRYDNLSRRLPEEVSALGPFLAAGAVLQAVRWILHYLRDLDRPGQP